ncbi:DUF2788 domain-containing protein [Thioflexithrix psekupsensis]|uniref:DUF2788 domain-containing protein n=1 Tax=Thioflexithrix psekupsensis TaxID=1570016 RepID=UPI001FD9DE4B|nr:DUF2788 domain-containing protein [Thioflexithrix psekupsensis]
MIDLKTWAVYEQYFLTIGLFCLIAYMMFIIFKLGQESKAGKWGYFVLFLALGLGMFGFIAKTVIVELLEL